MRALIALLAVAAIAVAFYVIAQTEAPEQPPVQTGAKRDGVADTRTAPLDEETELDAGEGQDSRTLVAPAPVQPDTMEPQRAAATTGWKNSIQGTVLDPAGQPVGEAKLALTLGGRNILTAPPDGGADVHLTTGEDGKYVFEDLDPTQRYTIVAGRSGVGRRIESDLYVEAGDTLALDLTLQRGAQVFGTVSDSGGGLVGGAEVTLIDQLMVSKEAGTLTTISGDDGSYAFEDLVPGTHYSLSAWLDGYGRATVGRLEVTGADGIQQNLVLDVAYLIEGIVTTLDGTPLADVSVKAHGMRRTGEAASTSTTKTDENGVFTFADIRKGIYNLVATTPGYRTGTARRISTGDLGVEVQLEAEPSITGRVLGADGAPLTRFTVQLRRRIANSTDTMLLPRKRFKVNDSPDGVYLISCPKAGEYAVEAVHPDFAPTISAVVTVSDGQQVKGVDIAMASGGVIRGRIVGADGPIAGARVGSHDSDHVVGDPFMQGIKLGNATTLQVVTGDDGAFELVALTPADYQIHVVASGHSALTQRDIVVQEGNESDLGDVTLSTGGKMNGVVRSASGEPVSGAKVVLVLDAKAAGDTFGATFDARTGPDGAYSFEAVPHGPYKVYAMGGGGDVLSNAGNTTSQIDMIIVEGATQTQDFQLPK